MTSHANAGQALGGEHLGQPAQDELLQAYALGDGELMQALPIGSRQAYAQGYGSPLPSPAASGDPLTCLVSRCGHQCALFGFGPRDCRSVARRGGRAFAVCERR